MISENGLPAIHPGEYLAEMLDETGMSQSELARRIGVSRMCISHIVNGKRPVTAEIACLIGRFFSQTPQYWMNLQTSYDLKILDGNLKNRLHQICPIDMTGIQ